MIGGATDAGQGFVYSGQIEKGQMHGKGTLVYPNGKLFGISTWGVHCDAYPQTMKLVVRVGC